MENRIRQLEWKIPSAGFPIFLETGWERRKRGNGCEFKGKGFFKAVRFYNGGNYIYAGFGGGFEREEKKDSIIKPNKDNKKKRGK